MQRKQIKTNKQKTLTHPGFLTAGPLRSREPLLSHTVCLRSTSLLLTKDQLVGIIKRKKKLFQVDQQFTVQ